MGALLRHRLLSIGIAFVLTRLILVLIGLVAMAALPMTKGEEYAHLAASPVLDMWYRWDAGFYSAIARYGYGWQASGHLSADMVFMPMYPMAIHALDQVEDCSTPECAALNGVLISNVALLLATYGVYDLVAGYADEPTAWQAVWLLLVVPGGVFLSGAYAEALFFLLTVLVFELLRRDHFLLAAALAGLAALTRPIGIALYASLLVYRWQRDRLRSWSSVLAAHFPLVSFGGYLLAAGLVTGDWLAYFDVYHQVWNRTASSSPLQTILAYFGTARVSWWGWGLSWMDLIFAGFYLVLAVQVLRRDWVLGVFALATVVVPIASGNLSGMPRYGMVVFPFYLVLARWADARWKRIVLYGGSVTLMVLFTARFVIWRWLA